MGSSAPLSLSILQEIQLRFLNPSDIEEVKKLCREWFPIEYPDSWYEEITSTARFYSLAATHNARIVGLVVAEIKPQNKLNKEDGELLGGCHTPATQVAYILSLGVVGDFRKNGIAITPTNDGLARIVSPIHIARGHQILKALFHFVIVSGYCRDSPDCVCFIFTAYLSSNLITDTNDLGIDDAHRTPGVDVAVAHTEDTNVQIIQNDLGIDNANRMPGVDVTAPHAEDTAVQDNPNWSVNDCTVVRYKDRGYPASLLLDSLLSYLTSKENSNCKAVYLHVLSTNTVALRFYERRCFERHLFLPYYYAIQGKARDGYLYVLYINGGQPPWSFGDYLRHCSTMMSKLQPCALPRHLYGAVCRVFQKFLSCFSREIAHGS